MHNPFWFTGHLLFVFIQIVCNFFSSSNVAFAGEDPFTPKASLVRYWKAQIRADIPQPSFLLSKVSPMTAVESATFSKLASQSALAPNLASFCSKAHMLCFPDLAQSLEKHLTDVNFKAYLDDKNFTNYGSSRAGGVDSFMSYSNGVNIPIDSFRHYSRDSAGRTEGFSVYSDAGNVVDQRFNNYGVKSTGGINDFKTYNPNVNEPNLVFTGYSTDGNGGIGRFTSYTEDTNAGTQSFANYGKKGNVTPLDFNSYGKNANVMTSKFMQYSQSAIQANGSFVSYGSNGNVPENDFKSYDDRGEGGTLAFTSYREQSNVGQDSFQSYAKKTTSQTTSFTDYGKSFNKGNETFNNYGQGATKNKIGFSGYGDSYRSFIGYADKNATSFADYANNTVIATANASSGKPLNRWIEPGKFFRESVLKQNTVTTFPDITDKMPRRRFLPRSISSKLPFSSAKLPEMKQIFHAADNSSMEKIIVAALKECERTPSAGEKRRCVASLEDMVDFAVSNLGRNVMVRTTENVEGSKKDVMIGSVKVINGAQEMAVSCHQMLYASLIYYCHSVPNVRVYEAQIHDPTTRKKINVGVAICHLDTSSWSPTHGAFLALGSGPGKIEVCHWIFENDMNWTQAD